MANHQFPDVLQLQRPEAGNAFPGILLNQRAECRLQATDFPGWLTVLDVVSGGMIHEQNGQATDGQGFAVGIQSAGQIVGNQCVVALAGLLGILRPEVERLAIDADTCQSGGLVVTLLRNAFWHGCGPDLGREMGRRAISRRTARCGQVSVKYGTARRSVQI